MSRQYFFVEVPHNGDPEEWEAHRTHLADLLGVSLRQVIVVYGAHVHAIEVQEPGEGKK